MMLRALDLFCCAGGATRGLQLAGYHVTGVDIDPQPHYCGDVFVQGDAFDWLERDLSAFDLIWASPKCQAHSNLTPAKYKGNHEVQLPKVLELLRAQSVPYIVENVQGTQIMMRDPVMLCGSMFGLDIWRHRWFEIGNVDTFFLLPSCDHGFAPVLVSGTPRRGGIRKEPDLASFCAFALSGASDALVYHLLRDRAQLVRINGSNVVSGLVDSIVFLSLLAVLAGLPWPAVPLLATGQWLAKVGGGALWSVVLVRAYPAPGIAEWPK